MNPDHSPNLKNIWIPLPYIGKHGTRLTNSFIRKITPLLKSQCKIIINWQTTDAGSFVSLKDPRPKQYKSSIVYEFKCPGCNANYIGKTDRCLYNPPELYWLMYIITYITCNEFNYIKNILQITPYDDTSINCSLTDLIFTNTKIIDKSRHWSLLLHLESIAINRHKPTLNHGTKGSKDLLIFN